MLPLILTQLGCGPQHDKQVHSFLAEEWYGQACRAARESGDPELQAKVDAELLRRLDLKLAMEPVPIEAFGVDPRQYGETWMLVGLGQTRTPEVADSVDVLIDFDTWTPCPSCDSTWMLGHMSVPKPEGKEPEVTVVKHAGTGLFGGLAGLGKALVDLGKVVGGLVVLPMTVMVDTMLLPITAKKGDNVKPFGLTKLTADMLMGKDVSGRVTAPINADLAVTAPRIDDRDGSVTCKGDLPCSTMVVYKGEEPPTSAVVTVRLARGDCGLTHELTLPITSEGDVAERMLSVFPSEGRLLPLSPEDGP